MPRLDGNFRFQGLVFKIRRSKEIGVESCKMVNNMTLQPYRTIVSCTPKPDALLGHRLHVSLGIQSLGNRVNANSTSGSKVCNLRRKLNTMDVGGAAERAVLSQIRLQASYVLCVCQQEGQ